MANKITIAVVAGCALALLPSVPTLADTPPEVACWEDSQVAQPVILDAIGTILIGTRLKGERNIRTYAVNSGSYVFERSIGLLEDTLPLSSNNCIRAPSWGYFAGGRYPVVGLDGNYLQVVIDPLEDVRVWLDRRELHSDFYAEIEVFGSTGVESLAVVTPR